MSKIYLNEISKEFGIPGHVIRFYDDKGLLPFVKRDNDNNYRYVEEEDKNYFKVIVCLKETGMPLADIREYIKLAMIGDSTLEQRQQMILNQQVAAKKHMEDLQAQLDYLDYKVNFYEEQIDKLKKKGNK